MTSYSQYRYFFFVNSRFKKPIIAYAKNTDRFIDTNTGFEDFVYLIVRIACHGEVNECNKMLGKGSTGFYNDIIL